MHMGSAQPIAVAQQRLSLTKEVFTTACTKLGMLSYGRAQSCGQNFAPRSAFLIPEMVSGGS